MTISSQPKIKALSLKEFLEISETKPASEYINGHIYQKPMPQGNHSTLQGRFATIINQLCAKTWDKARLVDCARRKNSFNISGRSL